MAMLSEEEKRELRELSASSALKEDIDTLLRARHNPFIVNGRMDIDIFLAFLTEYNRFVNHAPKLFHRIIDNDMRL